MRYFVMTILLGQYAEAVGPGSNFRRLLGRIAVLFVLLLIGETIYASNHGMVVQSLIVAVCLILYAVGYFGYVLIYTPFRSTAEFHMSSLRLMSDALISACLTILGFALAYRALGIIPPAQEATRVIDYLYFSSVTFATLGYGDFRPSADARLLAAFQALLGNLHLGVVIGAMFLKMSRKSGG